MLAQEIQSFLVIFPLDFDRKSATINQTNKGITMPTTTTTVTTYTTPDGVVFEGDTSLLDSVTSCLFGDEYANINLHKSKAPLMFHSSWFEWGDKGCFRAWGLNAKGKVVCGIRSYQNTGMASPKIEVKQMDACHDWGG